MGDPVQVASRLWWVIRTGARLNVQPSTLKVTEIGAQECQYALFLQYGIELLDIIKFCDSCNATSSI